MTLDRLLHPCKGLLLRHLAEVTTSGPAVTAIDRLTRLVDIEPDFVAEDFDRVPHLAAVPSAGAT